VVSQYDLPPAVRETAGREDEASGTLPERVAALETRAIAQALEAEGGNQSRAAARLGISERALRYKLGKLRDRKGES
jgi:DNA-binding NtrC family response regulator